MDERKNALPRCLVSWSPPWTITYDGEVWTAWKPYSPRLVSPYPDDLAAMIQAADG